ncbi:hypothetical protein [Photorhabdus akhurstii]|uniref:hypothetical protein n=1 Tax=Photorhabdus akhurstii TaxID=171438 RepID=UPI000D3F6602|nr:hypothetical protein C6H69_14690 [Photorhabdus luminescens]
MNTSFGSPALLYRVEHIDYQYRSAQFQTQHHSIDDYRLRLRHNRRKAEEPPDVLRAGAAAGELGA